MENAKSVKANNKTVRTIDWLFTLGLVGWSELEVINFFSRSLEKNKERRYNPAMSWRNENFKTHCARRISRTRKRKARIIPTFSALRCTQQN